MPIFRSTHNILHTPWEDEVHNDNWFDGTKLILPPGGPDDKSCRWDYKRDLKIEDVDIWEELYYETGGKGVYAAWKPYAELYMITTPIFVYPKIYNTVESYYGPMAQDKVLQRAAELNISLWMRNVWVDDEDMWLYQEPEKKIII
jgi:hypothetical protein